MPKGLNTPGALKGPDKDRCPMTATTIATETHQPCTPPVRLKTLKLDELSEELDKRTKETQMLQEEIENATREAFQKVCCITGLKPRGNREREKNIGPSRNHDPSRPAASGLDVSGLEATRPGFSFSGNNMLENPVEDYSQQVSEPQRQINESHDHCEWQAFHQRQAIIQLQTRLQQLDTEKDFLSHLRMVDSRRHAWELDRLQAVLCDLQAAQRSGEQRLQQVQEEARALSSKAESLEGTVREAYATLMAHRPAGSAGLPAPGGPGQLWPLGRLALEVLEDLEQERDQLREGLSQVLEKLKSEEWNHQAKAEVMLKEQQDRMERLIAGHDQQVAMLTEKCNSNATLLLKLERLQKHAESQESMHNCQVKELDSLLSSHKDRVTALEQQVCLAQAQAQGARRGRERSLKQVEELQSKLGRLTEELQRAKEELGEEKERGSLLQERSRELQAVAEKLQKDLEERSGLAHHLHSLLGTVQQDCLAQMEALRGRERQQRRELHEEVLSLRGQLETAREVAEGRLLVTPAERRSQSLLAQRDQERRPTQQEYQQASVAEQGLHVQKPTLQREQLQELPRTQKLSHAAEAQEEHQEQQLREQLRRTQEELQEALSTLRTLEDTEGHGLKVARGMQKEVTSQRQQIAALQSRIQLLEATAETRPQEKSARAQRSETRELASLREQRSRLAEEVEALSSRETQHKDRVWELEKALHKMSERFARCQDSLQRQEQESVRLKLDHALVLKELQGHSLVCAAAMGAPPSPPPPAPPCPPWQDAPEMKSAGLQDRAVLEPPSLVRELRGVMSENPGPPVDQHLTMDPSRIPPGRVPDPTGTTPQGSSGAPPGGRHPSRLNTRSSPAASGTPALAAACGLKQRVSANGVGGEPPFPGRRDARQDSTRRSCGNFGGSRPSTPTASASSRPAAACRSPVHSLLTSDPRHKSAKGGRRL